MSDTGRQSMTDKASAALKVCSVWFYPRTYTHLVAIARLREEHHRAYGRQVQGHRRLHGFLHAAPSQCAFDLQSALILTRSHSLRSPQLRRWVIPSAQTRTTTTYVVSPLAPCSPTDPLPGINDGQGKERHGHEQELICSPR